MKKLFFLLLVVNLVIWLWGQREQLARVAQTAPPDLGVIRLLEPAEVDARREQARREADASPPTTLERAGEAGQPEGPLVVTGVPANGGSGPGLADDRTPASPATDAAGQPSDVPPRTPSPSHPATELPPVPEPALAADSVPPEPIDAAAKAGESLEATAVVPVVELPPGAEAMPITGADAPATASEGPPSAAPEPVSDAIPPVAEATATAPREVAGDVSAAAPVAAEAVAPLVVAEAGAAPPAAVEPGADQAAVAAPVVAEPEPVVAEAVAAPPAAVEPDLAQAAVAAPVVAEPDVAEPAAPERAVTEPIVTTSVVTTPDTAATVDAPASPTDSEPADAPAVEVREAPTESTAPPVAPSAVPYVCESIGPFADRPAAARTLAGLAAPLRGVAIREERSSRPVRHWVVAPVQPSKEATAEYLTGLAQAGVKDAWRIPSGPLAGRLAVGVFQSAVNARKHADMLAAKGVSSEVHAPTNLEPVRAYWIDYERPSDVPPPEAGAGRGKPPRQIVPRSCGRVAGSETLP
jgi:hypothetical protein